LVFTTSASNLVVKITFYSGEQVLVYVFFTVAKKFFDVQWFRLYCIFQNM